MKKIRIFPLILITITGLFLSCGQISQKEQRAKLQFLYQLKNFSSLANEYTHMLTYKKDIPGYRTKIERMRNDAEGMTVIVQWERSLSMRSEFIGLLKHNLDLADTLLLNKNLNDDSKIDYDPAIIEMKDNTGRFLINLDAVISEAGKE